MPSVQHELIRRVAANGLAAIGFDFTRQPDGSFRYRGRRPGPDYYAHGTFSVCTWDLFEGRLQRIVVYKPRWRLRGTNKTVHSRPPDDLGRRYTAIVIALCLFAMLDAAVGLHRYKPLFDGPADTPSRRTQRRWLDQLRPYALEIQHRIRAVVLTRLKSRPLKSVFPGGMPPPKRWRGPAQVQLHQALAMLLVTSITLEQPSSSLLAEA